MTRADVLLGLARMYGMRAARRIMRFVAPPTGATGCWLWTGGVAGEKARPCVWLEGRSVQVARLVLSVKLGRDVRSSMLAGHDRDVGMCVNPAHLAEKTPGQNLLEAWSRGRRSAPVMLPAPTRRRRTA